MRYRKSRGSRSLIAKLTNIEFERETYFGFMRLVHLRLSIHTTSAYVKRAGEKEEQEHTSAADTMWNIPTISSIQMPEDNLGS